MRSTAVALAAALLACGSPEEAVHPQEELGNAVSALAAPASARPDAAEPRYIVQLREDTAEDVDALADELMRRHGGGKRHTYRHAFKGFAVAHLPAPALEALRRHPRVLRVVPDLELTPSATAPSSHWSRDAMDGVRDRTFTSFFDGQGVHVYVLDSGIDRTHPDFGGRVGDGKSVIWNVFNWAVGDPFNDLSRHGTRVAQVAAGASTGLAPGATLHPVKVFHERGAFTSDVVAGVDWVAANAQRPAVLNVSLNCEADDCSSLSVLRDALSRLTAQGVSVVKSAGNLGRDACLDPPHTSPHVVVVGGADQLDFLDPGSNFGSCVTLTAPMDWFVDLELLRGTSLSAPAVAGVVAQMLQEAQRSGSSLSPAQVKEFLRQSAFKDKLNPGSLNGTPNLFANSLHTLLRYQSPAPALDTYGGRTYTWSVAPFGGDPGAWSITWLASLNGGLHGPVGSGTSHQRYFSPGTSGSYFVEARASNAGQYMSATSNHPYYPFTPEPPPVEDPPPTCKFPRYCQPL